MTFKYASGVEGLPGDAVRIDHGTRTDDGQVVQIVVAGSKDAADWTSRGGVVIQDDWLGLVFYGDDIEGDEGTVFIRRKN